MTGRTLAAGCALLLCSVGAVGMISAAKAHHSFAVFFDDSRTVAVEGRVTAFRFTNPHGTIALEVTKPNGTVENWRVETTAPVVLRRRGWSRTSIHAGDELHIEGWPARDGKPYLRLQSAATLDGRAIGQAFSSGED